MAIRPYGNMRRERAETLRQAFGKLRRTLRVTRRWGFLTRNPELETRNSELGTAFPAEGRLRAWKGGSCAFLLGWEIVMYFSFRNPSVDGRGQYQKKSFDSLRTCFPRPKLVPPSAVLRASSSAALRAGSSASIVVLTDCEACFIREICHPSQREYARMGTQT